jgi:DNA-binding NtrC family response regulator
MTQILLAGMDEPLLEGLVQTLVAVGHGVRIAHTLAEARDSAAAAPPMIAVIDHALALDGASPAGPALGIPLAPGGAYVLFHTGGGAGIALPHTLQRQVLANLALPLERNRLVALVQIVEERARAAGRGRESGSSDELRRR